MESFNANLQGGKKLVKSLEKQSVRARTTTHACLLLAPSLRRRFELATDSTRVLVAARELPASAVDARDRGFGRGGRCQHRGGHQRVNTAARDHAGRRVSTSGRPDVRQAGGWGGMLRLCRCRRGV